MISKELLDSNSLYTPTESFDDDESLEIFSKSAHDFASLEEKSHWGCDSNILEQEFHDEGYFSAASPASNEDAGGSHLFDDVESLECAEMVGSNDAEPNEYVHEFYVDNLMNDHELGTDILPEEATLIHYEPLHHLMDEQNDLSMKLIDIEKDPTLHPESIQLKKIAVYENKQLSEELFLENKKKNDQNKQKRHKRGQKPMCLKQIKDEVHKKNIVRCREYRVKKNENILEELTELELLEKKNKELREKEIALRERVQKLKNSYIKLISEGRVRFC